MNIEKEPTIERENNPERRVDIPKKESVDNEEVVGGPRYEKRVEKKIEEINEKEKFYEKEVEGLVKMAKEEGFEKA